MREIGYPSVPVLITGVLPETNGGTGMTTVGDVVSALGAVPQSMIGQPGGLVALNAQGVVASPSVLEGVINTISIVGVTSLVVNQSATFTINNYDIATTYTLVANGGSVSRNGDTITYTAPSVGGNGGFTINGRVFAISVVMPYVNTPSVTSPVNGTTGLGSSVTITSSAFNVVGGSDTHYSSDWQVATDSGFVNLVQNVVDSTTNKTSFALMTNPSTTYYVRVRHKGSTYGYSNWSSTISFVTKSSFYAQNEIAKLTASDGATNDWFGRSVAISSDGKTAIVGASNDDSFRGSAYIFG